MDESEIKQVNGLLKIVTISDISHTKICNKIYMEFNC